MVVIGLLILLRPKSKRQPNAPGSAVDNKEWLLTGQIDFVDPHSPESYASGRRNADC